MPEFESAELSERERARILKSAVSPRPIAWITTTDDDGNENLAPFSSYTYVSATNPVVAFNTPNESHGGLKDTARNALDTGEFAVNVVTEPHLDQMDHTSAPLSPTESEFELAGIEPAECRRIDPPRVADSPITLECTVYDSLTIYDRLMILGDVEYVHLADSVLTNGELDMEKLPTVGRLGGPYYTVSDPVDFERRY